MSSENPEKRFFIPPDSPIEVGTRLVTMRELSPALVEAAIQLKRIDEEHSGVTVTDFVSEQELSRIAFRYFVDAARTYPVSVTMQALHLAESVEKSALRCRLPDTYEPSSLVNCLRIRVYDDPSIIERIINVAVNIHKKRSADVDPEDVIQRSFCVIDGVFQSATAFSITKINDDKRRTLEELYKHLHSEAPAIETEGIIRLMALAALRST